MTQSEPNSQPGGASSPDETENRHVTSSISSALSRVRENMAPLTQESGQVDGDEGRSPMAAPGSWFRRLWNPDDEAVVSILPRGEGQGIEDSPQAPELQTMSAETEQVHSESAPANFPVDNPVQYASNGVSPVEDVATPDQRNTTVLASGPELSYPVAVPRGESTLPVEGFERALQATKESTEPSVSTLPMTKMAQERERPRRPLSYHELAKRLPALPVAATPVLVSSAPTQPPAGHPTMSAPASISAGRRAAGQPAANPFERPSLYRPPSTDESFDAAFTTPPEVADQLPSGRWDPIPTLRPSGWRDSGSYRAANDSSNDEPWDWTSGKTPPLGAGWQDAPAPAPVEESELILTRQWGLLSRFQQSRGVGLANRRTARPDDDSGSQDAAESIPTPNRRKG